MVYDAGKLRSSIVSVLISAISDMGLIEPQNIMGWVRLAACCQGPCVSPWYCNISLSSATIVMEKSNNYKIAQERSGVRKLS